MNTLTTKELIMVGDFGKDLDDENALLYSVGLQLDGQISLKAVVANLDPAQERARLAKGMLEVLDVNIPVGIGTACTTKNSLQDYEIEVPYLAKDTDLPAGIDLMVRTLESADDDSVTLVLNSGMTDAAELFQGHAVLAKRKLARVAIMGGVQTTANDVLLNDKGRMQPDTAANNMFDFPASEFVYDWAQAHEVPMTIVTREAAYACQFDFAFYERMAESGNPIGRAIRNRQIPAIQDLWRLANTLADSEERGTLPNRCDRSWFVNTYLAGKDPGDIQDIWPTAITTGKFQLYDSLNVAAIVKPNYFDFLPVPVGKITHSVAGVSKQLHGVGNAIQLRNHIQSFEMDALHHDRSDAAANR